MKRIVVITCTVILGLIGFIWFVNGFKTEFRDNVDYLADRKWRMVYNAPFVDYYFQHFSAPLAFQEVEDHRITSLQGNNLECEFKDPFSKDKDQLYYVPLFDSAYFTAIGFAVISTGIDGILNFENGSPMTFLNGKNVEEAIRSLQVSQSVSAVSVLPCVRDFVDRQLRKWGENKGIVMDGRDIGTAVFPQAELKIFMTAPVEIRARRRLNEMLAKGQNATFEEVLDNVEQRDYLDSHRSKNPLSRADDAIVLDNGNMTIPQQMEWFMKLFEEKWGTRPQ